MMRPGLLSDIVTAGYEMFLDGDHVKLSYRKQGNPPDTVRPLIDELRECTAEAVKILQTDRAVIAYAVLCDERDKIVQIGRWRLTPEVREAEGQINRLYHDILDGRGKLVDFKAVCERWRREGTK